MSRSHKVTSVIFHSHGSHQKSWASAINTLHFVTSSIHTSYLPHQLTPRQESWVARIQVTPVISRSHGGHQKPRFWAMNTCIRGWLKPCHLGTLWPMGLTLLYNHHPPPPSNVPLHLLRARATNLLAIPSCYSRVSSCETDEFLIQEIGVHGFLIFCLLAYFRESVWRYAHSKVSIGLVRTELNC